MHAARRGLLPLFAALVAAACGSATGSDGSDAGPQPGPARDGGTRRDAGGAGLDAGATFVDLPAAGNPSGSCSTALPPEARLVDTSTPTTVIGNGTPASCTHQALAAAVANAGIITFNCGPDQKVIPIEATLELRTDRTTVIDGGNKVVLDGRGAVRILWFEHMDYRVNDNGLTLKRIALINGKTTPTDAIPTRPAPCSQGYNDGEGAALYMRDGLLRVIDCVFLNNQAAQLGPDTGGGAIYILGAKPAVIAHSTFKDNSASNAGGFGALQTGVSIYDSLFEGNRATGTGANNDDASQCDYINNGQHQVGSGGNGGAIYNDGVHVDVTICGTMVRNNASNEFGAALFFTSNDQSAPGTLSIRDSTMYGNTSPKGWQWRPGISTNANALEPVNSDIR